MTNQASPVDDRTQKSGGQNKNHGGNREGGAQGDKKSSNREGGKSDADRDRGTGVLKEDDDASKDAESFGKSGNR